MWNLSVRLGEIVSGIDNPRKMLHDELFLLAPFLDGKVLDINVPSIGCGTLLIDHTETCHIVNELACWARPKSIKCCEDAAKTFCDFPTSHR